MLNLAIDGETASSFMTNAGRTPPVMGRGDAPLQLENLNYGNSTAVSQGALFASAVAAQAALGNTVGTVTITLGFNELAALAPTQNTPAAEAAALDGLPPELAQGMFARPAAYPVVMRVSTNPGDILETWRPWATAVRGRGLDCGHHMAEEARAELAAFLAGP